jgi:hypothetical protein
LSDGLGSPPNGGPPSGRRAAQRRKRLIWGSIAAGVIALGVIAGVIAAVGSRSGTLTNTQASPLTGAGAAELLAKIPPGSVSAGSVQLGPNVAVTAMTVAKNPDGSFSGSGTVSIANAVSIAVSATIVDASNWTFTAVSGTNAVYPIGTSGIRLDPSTISGTITDVAGAIQWNLTGSTITWPVASGVTLTTNFSLGTQCPFTDTTKCPTSPQLYVGLPSGALAISGLPTVNLVGGVALNDSWARLEGSANTSATFGVPGASALGTVSMSNPQFTIWRGSRQDSYDPNMQFPDTSPLNGGTSVELCGNFGITIPTVVNKTTGGCVRWTPVGIVLGQVGSGMSLSGGGMPSGATADVKGIGFSNLSMPNLAKISLGSTPGAMSFSGVITALQTNALSLGGRANLPGAVATALGKANVSLPVDVTGLIKSDAISLTGTIPVNIKFGTDPFKVDVQSMQLSLDAASGHGVSFGLSTSSSVTLGYGSSARQVNSSISLQAATSPAVGFTLSLSAQGSPAAGDTADGLTPKTALKYPSKATYLVPDMFGVGGLNLWSLTGQIGWQGTSPSVAFATTTYLDPKGSSLKKVLVCKSDCGDADWMVGNLGIDMSVSTPCFAYSFDSSGNSTTVGSAIAIDGGVLTTSKFQVGIAPKGCSIDAAGTPLSLPDGFAGLRFSATFGSATFDLGTQVSPEGFVFDATLGNVNMGGFSLSTLALHVSITSTASSVSFDAAMGSRLGTLVVHADMSADSSGMSWLFSGTICTDTTGNYCNRAALDPNGQSSSPTIAAGAASGSGGSTQNVGYGLPYFTFSQSGTISSCSSLSGSASGVIVMGGKSYVLAGPNQLMLPDGKTLFAGTSFSLDCHGLQSANFGLQFTHSSQYVKGTGQVTLVLAYSKASDSFQGGMDFSFARHVHIHEGSGQTIDRDPSIDLHVDVIITSSVSQFTFGGSISTSRVEGTWSFTMSTNGDFAGSIDVRVDIPWGSYRHLHWNGDM